VEFPISFYQYNHLNMPKRIDWETQIGRRLRLRDLHAFLTVVNFGSMAKAAKQLGVSQPAVSKVVADLEYALGVRLLDRSQRGVEPTIYGQALVRRGASAFDELKQCIRDIEFLTDSSQGEVRIQCSGAAATTMLPQLIQRFSERYPRVVLHVDAELVPSLGLPPLRRRDYDLMLAQLPIPLPEAFRAEDLDVEVISEDRLIIAAGRHNPLARRRELDLATLVKEPWIMQAPYTWNYLRLKEACEAQGLAMPNSTLFTLTNQLRVHFLANGPYVTLMARSLAQFHGLRELALDLPDWRFPISILTLKNRMLSPVVKRFIERTREFARSTTRPKRR
jgi:DNA-binding transcriptional LysR family regulator